MASSTLGMGLSLFFGRFVPTGIASSANPSSSLIWPALSEGGPRGLAEEPLTLRALGVPLLLEGPISDIRASDIITDAILGDWKERKLMSEVRWRGVVLEN